MPHLSRDSILKAAEHIIEVGDTDIFPYPVEMRFLRDAKEAIVEELAHINIATYSPMTAVESLVPKGRYSFRAAHQLFLADTLIFTAAVLEVAPHLERARIARDELRSFSYRFDPDSHPKFFTDDCGYRQWLSSQSRHRFHADDFTHVIETDISDFYQRIYHHRLENNLAEFSENRPANRFIISFLRDLRARQSFGLPVGTSAARIVAELALIDLDRALTAAGYEATRYVDDLRIFVRREQSPQSMLAFVAEHLLSNEGLSLSAAKTRIHSSQYYFEQLHLHHSEDREEAEQAAEERLFGALYGEDDPELIAQLNAEDLIGELDEALERIHWNLGEVRYLIRCLRLAQPNQTEAFIRSNIGRLLPFAKDVVLLMQEMQEDGAASFRDMADQLIDIILDQYAGSISYIRSWLFELFIRGVVEFDHAHVRRLSGANGIIDQRAIIQMRMMLRDVAYFRGRKTRIDEFSDWIKPVFIYGASCLPREEYRTWLGNINERVSFPLSRPFVAWARTITPQV